MTLLSTSYGFTHVPAPSELSRTGSLGVMNARRLSHLKHAGAWAALEIARQDVLADVQQHISLSTLDMARCVSDFSDVNNVDMKVCGSWFVWHPGH